MSAPRSISDAPHSRRPPRRRSREYALQGIYQWLLAGGVAGAIGDHVASDLGFGRADGAFFRELLAGVIMQAAELDALLSPALDRPLAELSPVEHAILLLAIFELRDRPEIPSRVIVNEAIELAKSYGGTDGYKYVNGVLDGLARQMRPPESGAPKS